jgi:hypothetical protein
MGIESPCSKVDHECLSMRVQRSQRSAKPLLFRDERCYAYESSGVALRSAMNEHLRRGLVLELCRDACEYHPVDA